MRCWRRRIVNDVQLLASVMARAGDCPDVVLEATYGRYWAVDALHRCGWVAFPRRGSRPRPPGSCVCWSGITGQAGRAAFALQGRGACRAGRQPTRACPQPEPPAGTPGPKESTANPFLPLRNPA